MATIPDEAYIAKLVSVWNVQDALLQQYRTIFITMQSIFIAVAAALLQVAKPALPILLFTALAGFTLYLWVTICRARGEAVYVAQYLVLIAEDGEEVPKPINALKDFQGGGRSDFRADKRYKSLLNGTTRKKMESWLPTLFVIAWVCLWAIVDFAHYNHVFVRH